jgi:Right handed beta helix region
MSFENRALAIPETFTSSSNSSNHKSYYVSTTGDDLNPGTFSSPFRSLQSAINQIGDGEGGTIYLREGTYYHTQEPYVSEIHDGSEDSRLVIQAYEGEKVILDGSSVAQSGISIAGSYVDIIGLELRNATQGITGVRPNHLRLFNNTIHTTYSTGIGIYGIDSRAAQNVLVQGNTVYDTNVNNFLRFDYTWGSGIAISLVQNAEVKDNIVFNNWGEGIAITLTDNAIASGNYVYDNYSVEMYMDNASNSIFESNFIIDTGNSSFHRLLDGHMGYLPAYGIMLANEDYSIGQNLLNNNIIRNNVLVNTLGILTTGTFTNGQIINNTLYGSSETLLHIDEGNYENILIANNIFYQTNETASVYLPYSPSTHEIFLPSGIWVTHNVWMNGNPSRLVTGSNDIFFDPLFVNPGGSTPLDYQLQSDSPAIDRGSFAELVRLDFNLGLRSQDGNGDWLFGIDVGAFEFQGIASDWTASDWVEPAPVASLTVELPLAAGV